MTTLEIIEFVCVADLQLKVRDHRRRQSGGLDETVDLVKEIIIVYDSSLDITWDILNELADLPNVFFHYIKRKMSKGANMCTALENVIGDIMLIQDVDLEYYPQDYPALLPILEGLSQVV